MFETELQEFVRQLRALRDGGVNYTLDDLFDAIDGAHGRMVGISTPVRPGLSDVIERLQIAVNLRARKAA